MLIFFMMMMPCTIVLLMGVLHYNKIHGLQSYLGVLLPQFDHLIVFPTMGLLTIIRSISSSWSIIAIIIVSSLCRWRCSRTLPRLCFLWSFLLGGDVAGDTMLSSSCILSIGPLSGHKVWANCERSKVPLCCLSCASSLSSRLEESLCPSLLLSLWSSCP